MIVYRSDFMQGWVYEESANVEAVITELII